MPALQLLDAEAAHGAAIAAAAAGLAPVDGDGDAGAPELAGVFCGLNFSNPVLLAAGFDKQGEVVLPLLTAGFGGVEVGSVTPLPQPGNARPRMFRLTEDRAVINRFGFNSDGAVAVGSRLATVSAPGIRGLLGVNLGKNKDGDAAADYSAGMRLLSPFADYVVVNVSSPNTAGLRALQGASELRSLLRAVRTARDEVFGEASVARAATAAGSSAIAVTVPHGGVGAPPLALTPAASAAYYEAIAARRAARRPPPPLLVKIAPDLTDEDVLDIVAVARETGVDGLVVSNTTIARPEFLRSPHAKETGGLSGAPLLAPATAMLRKVYEASGGEIPLIGATLCLCMRDAAVRM